MRGKFVVVDRAGAVHGDVVDETALHQVDDVPVHAGAEHVRAHHQDAARLRCLALLADAPAMAGQIGMLERRGLLVERQASGSAADRDTLGERQHAQAGAVEQRVS